MNKVPIDKLLTINKVLIAVAGEERLHATAPNKQIIVYSMISRYSSMSNSSNSSISRYSSMSNSSY